MDKTKLAEMNRNELENLLAEKEELYADIEEQRKFILKQTGRHLSGEVIDRYEERSAELREQIKEIKKYLSE